MVVMELNEVFNEAESINVYNDGVKVSYASGGKEFEKVLKGWNTLIDGAHQMPAFGVSLNRETVKQIQSGLWAEFVFDGVKECDGMPFEKLLINVIKDFQGFNIIRYNSNYGYDGRCFYYDLVGRNMADFYDILVNL